jgi:hypothetical protein
LWRATGASTLTGGRSDGCASAPETDATAIRPATADTLLEMPSNFPALSWIAAFARSDRGVMTCPILLFVRP